MKFDQLAQEAINELSTLQDFVRWAVSRMGNMRFIMGMVLTIRGMKRCIWLRTH